MCHFLAMPRPIDASKIHRKGSCEMHEICQMLLSSRAWLNLWTSTGLLKAKCIFELANFFASSIKLLSCCSSSSWGNMISFEHGWSYRKNSNAGKFVLSYRFIHKNFRLVRGPVFCPVSGFCTSDGPIEKIPMQANLYSHADSSIKITG